MPNIGVDVVIGYPIPNTYMQNTVQPGWAWAGAYAPSIQTTQQVNKSISSIVANAQANALVPVVNTSSALNVNVSPTVASAQASALAPTTQTAGAVSASPTVASASASAGVPSVTTTTVINTFISSVVAGATASAGIPTVSTSGGSTVLASDSFNRSNNTVTMGSTDSAYGGTAKTWQFLGTTGTYGIISNQAYASAVATSGHNVVVVDVGQSNFTVQATFAIIGSSESPKIAIRVQDQENTLLLQVSSTGANLYSYTSGATDSDIATWSGAPVNGDIFKVTTNGTTITIYRNGTQIIQATTAKYQSATKCGIMAYHYPNSRFDDFQVTSP